MRYSLKSITKLSTAALATLCLASLADARHEKNLPTETYFVAQIEDNAALQKRAKDHPLTIAAKKSGLQEFLSNSRDRIFAAGKTGISAEKLKLKEKKLETFFETSLTGEVLFSVVKTTQTAEGHDPLDCVFLADTSADEKMIGEIIDIYFDGAFSKENTGEISEFEYLRYKAEREGKTGPKWSEDALTKTLKITYKPITTQFQGVTLHELQSTIEGEKPISSGGWALVNKTIVYATAPNVLRHLVDAVQHGRKDNFGDTTIWKRSRADAGNADVFALANTPLIVAELRATVVKEDAKDIESDGPALSLTSGTTQTQIFDALALNQIGSLWASATITAEGASFKSVLPYKEKKGLLALFSAKPLEKLVPDYVSANTIAFGSLGIDLNKAWKNLETLIKTAYPPAKPLLDMQIASLKSTEGVDLRGAIFENLGEDVTFAIVPNPTEVSTVNILSTIGIREIGKLQALLDTVIGKIGKGAKESLFSEHNFMGVKVSKITSDEKNIPQFSHTLLDGKLYYSLGKGGLESAIAEIKKPVKLETKIPAAANVLRKVPKDAVTFIYADYGALMLAYFGIMENIMKLTTNIFIDDDDDDTEKKAPVPKEAEIDKSKRPKLEDMPWFVYLYTTERANEIITEAHILPQKTK
jgi:hypothetical protein